MAYEVNACIITGNLSGKEKIRCEASKQVNDFASTRNFRLAVEISGVGSLQSAEIRNLLSLVNARLRLYTKYKRLALPEQVAAGAISWWRQAEKCISLSLSLSARFLSTIKMEETPVDAKDGRVRE